MRHQASYTIFYYTNLQGSLEDLEDVISASLETLLSSLPVEHLPDVLHVGSLAVEVLERKKERGGE